MKNRKNGERTVRRKLADGTIREYHYGPRERPVLAQVETVAKALSAWQRSSEWKSLRPRTTKNYIGYSQPLYEAFGDIPLRDVKRRHLLAIRDDMADIRGPGAALLFCRTMGAFFSWCVDREKVEASPTARLSSGLNRGTITTWTEERLAIALMRLPERYRRAVLLAAHTAQRRGDLVRMAWADWDGRRLTVHQEKPRKPVIVSIPLLPEMVAELERWHSHSKTPTILSSAQGAPWDADSLGKGLRRALRVIGLPDDLSLHGLRKLALVRLAMAGCTPHELMAISGHTTLSMVEHYTRAVRQVQLADTAMGRLQKQQNMQNDTISS